jgi:hypothetical protein
MKMIRDLSFRKLIILIVVTDVVLACLAAVLVANSSAFNTLPDGTQSATGQETKKIASRPKMQVPQFDTDAEAQEVPASAHGTFVPHTAPKPGVTRVDWNGRTITIVAAIFAVAIVMPTVLVVCFFVLLRRHIERLATLIHTKNAEPSFGAAHAQTAKPAASEGTVGAVHFPPVEQPTQKGGALFERLFEETLNLQTQLNGN